MSRKLSIIIPVYQVEAYVGKTLASVFATNTPTDAFEVIVVNDGTKDRSMDVVRQFADQPNLIILEQENQGLSAARMKGLSIASGEYVWFVDSDDWLVEDGVGIVMRLLEKWPGNDVLMFPIVRLFLDSKERKIDPQIEKERSLSGKDYIMEGWTPSPCARFVFKKRLLENKKLFFPAGLLHEDLYWGPVLLYLSEGIVLLPHPVYVYQQRTGSIMTSMNIRSAYDLIFVHKLLMDFMESEVDTDDMSFFRKYCFRILKWIYSLFANHYGKTDFKRFTRIHGYYVWKEWNQAFPDVSWKRRIKRLAFSMMPRVYMACFGVRAA